MEMTELDGLSAELRKAAKTTVGIIFDYDIAEESLREVLREEVWLRTDLVAKEMENHDTNALREIKELVQRKIKHNNEELRDYKYSLTETEFFGIIEAVLGKG